MKRFPVLFLACAACQLPETDLGPQTGPPIILPARRPTLDTPCVAGPEHPNGLLLTTTDFSTGAVTVVDTATHTVTPDVALGTPDAIPFFAGGRGLLVHRFQYDYVEILDPARGWASAGQHGLEVDGVTSPNPRAVALGPDGLAYVPVFGAAEIQILDLSQPPGSSFVGAIDVSPFADDDGVPETSLPVVCGDTMFVSIDRIETGDGFTRAGGDGLVAVDLAERTALDLDPDEDGAQAITTQGAWIKQLRVDPADPFSVLALTEGIERIALAEGTTTWAVPSETFAAAGITHYQLPIAFDLSGDTVYVAAYGPADGDTPDCAADPSPCFAEVRLFAGPLDGSGPLVPFGAGFDAVDRTLEVIGDELWFASRKAGEPGLWVFDLTDDPPRVADGPLSTGLPPYSLTAVELP
jgi:hypothetical protein